MLTKYRFIQFTLGFFVLLGIFYFAYQANLLNPAIAVSVLSAAIYLTKNYINQTIKYNFDKKNEKFRLTLHFAPM